MCEGGEGTLVGVREVKGHWWRCEGGRGHWWVGEGGRGHWWVGEGGEGTLVEV